MGSEYGRRKTLECGHMGEAVFGNFFVCLAKCNGKVPRRTTCPKCYSKNTAPFDAPMVPQNSMHCIGCGAVWFDP